MTIKIDMSPRLQPAGAANGFVRDNDQAHNPQVQKQNSVNDIKRQELTTEKSNSDKLNSQPIVDEKLTTNQKAEQENRSEIDKGQLDSVVTSLNSSIQSVQRDLEFSVDENSGQVVINVKDKETDQVVRQIPSEEALKLAENLQELVDSRRDKDSGAAEGIFVRTSA